METSALSVNAISGGHTAVRKNAAILFVLCFISSTLGGTVSTLMSVYLPVAVKDLLQDESNAHFESIGASINAIFIYGWMAGGFTWGFLCDRTGRRKAFIYSTLCYGIFTVLTGFSTGWLMVVIFRFLTGFGVGGVLVTTTILISEAYDQKRRAIALGILSISIPIGIFSAGLINYLITSWRYGFTAGLIPVFVALAGFFLIGSNYDSQIAGTAKKHALFHKATVRNLVAGSVIFGATLIGLWAIFAWMPSWIQSLSNTADAQEERGMSMMLLGGGGLLGGFISGWVVNAVGVRKTMIMCLAACFLLSFTLFRITHTISMWLYVQVALLAIFFGISQGALSVYIPQLFPRHIVASATGFCFNIGRLFTATVVFFIGSLEGFLGGYGNAVFTFSFVFLIGLLAVILFKTEKLQE
ncbi:MFS transporter [Panacibacter sp. DH6]|uniref:MFS transporter n=1 Tax=Panacibacter microcysteis TaxID=2793269 RepID=A0A931GYG4_9BACT|nr:MFS transporter [Panacibacter microcysteis]MBG9375867.1 MFS transporter [Panacibacter microcysteis]